MIYKYNTSKTLLNTVSRTRNRNQEGNDMDKKIIGGCLGHNDIILSFFGLVSTKLGRGVTRVGVTRDGTNGCHPIFS